MTTFTIIGTISRAPIYWDNAGCYEIVIAINLKNPLLQVAVYFDSTDLDINKVQLQQLKEGANVKIIGTITCGINLGIGYNTALLNATKIELIA